MAIGNTWEYHRYSSTYDGYARHSIIGDTLINGRYYFISQPYPSGTPSYRRIDTLNMQLMGLNPASGTESPVFNYVLEPGDLDANRDQEYLGDSLISTIAGDRVCHCFRGIWAPLSESETFYAEGLGKVEGWSHYHSEDVYHNFRLTACIINGIQYGTFSTLSTDSRSILPDALKLTLYPNPTNGGIHIEVTSVAAEAIGVKIIDVLGKEVFAEEVLSGDVNNLDFEIDASVFDAMRSGIYFVSITTNSESVVKKFIRLRNLTV